MFGEINIFRDGLFLLMLVFLVKHNFKEQYIKHASHSTLAKHVARKQMNKLKTGVSKTLNDVKESVSNSVGITSSKKHAAFEEQADTLLQQLNKAQTTLNQTDILSDKEKSTLALDIKTIRSHIEHVKKEHLKEPQELGLLSGPALRTARVVHKRNLEKKLLVSTNKTSNVLLTLHNELLGQDQKISPAISVLQGLEQNQSLLV
jgi:hypothetical protein